MSGGRYKGKVDHMVTVAAASGFSGFEPEVVMLDEVPAIDVRRILEGAQMSLASLVYVADWRYFQETSAERIEADKSIAFVQQFPGAVLLLVQMPGSDRSELKTRQQNAVACVNAVARRARDAGVHASFHPNSPRGSVFRTRSDYEALLEGLDPGAVGFTPDVGHIAAGGMEPLDVIRRYRDRVDHVHFKDIGRDGRWTPTGDGIVDFAGIVAHLRDTDYSGWIVLEDESPAAESDPDSAVRRNGEFVRGVLQPLVSAGVRAL